MMCADGGIEIGEARARVLRLVHELRVLRGVSHDQVISAVRASATYRTLGSPELGTMNLAQAQGLARMLERWLEQAKEMPPRARRVASAAPAATWRNHQTEGRKQP